MLPPVTRPLQWSAPLWPSPTQVVQPEAFVKISEQVGAIDPAGAIWRANTEEQVAPSHTWPRPGGPAPGTATASAVRPMPSPGGSVPGAAVLAAVPVASPGGSVPGAVTSSAAVLMEVDQGSAPQTLSVKRGFLRIRTAAVYIKTTATQTCCCTLVKLSSVSSWRPPRMVEIRWCATRSWPLQPCGTCDSTPSSSFADNSLRDREAASFVSSSQVLRVATAVWLWQRRLPRTALSLRKRRWSTWPSIAGIPPTCLCPWIPAPRLPISWSSSQRHALLFELLSAVSQLGGSVPVCSTCKIECFCIFHLAMRKRKK